MQKFSLSNKLHLIAAAFLLISLPLLVFTLIQRQEIRQRASSSKATVLINPPSGSYAVGQTFTADLVIDSKNKDFNAVSATILMSDNLSVQSLALGNCNFTFVDGTSTPTTGNPSFTGAILNGSSKNCTAYTLTVQVLSGGTGTITVANGSVKDYIDSSELLESMESGSYTLAGEPSSTPIPAPTDTPTPTTVPPTDTPTTIPTPTDTPTPTPTPTNTPTPTPTPTPVPTSTPTPLPTGIPTSVPTPTSLPVPPPTISTQKTPTYVSSITLIGTKDTTVTSIVVNNSSAGINYPSATSWQSPRTLTVGNNTFDIYAQDALGRVSTNVSTTISLHRLGDINGDTAIDLVDLSLFATDWNKTGGLNYSLSDMNDDGTIDLTDFSIFARVYGN